MIREELTVPHGIKGIGHIRAPIRGIVGAEGMHLRMGNEVFAVASGDPEAKTAHVGGEEAVMKGPRPLLIGKGI